MEKFEDMLEELYFCQEVELSKKEKKILKVLNELGEMEFYDLLEILDIKPTRLEKHLIYLEDNGFIKYDDNEDKITLAPQAGWYLATNKKERKENKKFLKFINSLSDEELEEFKILVEETLPEETAEEEADEQ